MVYYSSCLFLCIIVTFNGLINEIFTFPYLIVVNGEFLIIKRDEVLCFRICNYNNYELIRYECINRNDQVVNGTFRCVH